jgi:hypothetical protein
MGLFSSDGCHSLKLRLVRKTWAGQYHSKTLIDFSRPGKPTDNCYVETFNGSLRDECLNVHWFETLEDAKATIEAWRRDYNELGLTCLSKTRRQRSTSAERAF